MISYAQNLEDVVLNRLFQNKPNGFYIDIGAHDPTELSVTRHFYDLGWHGINIEPIPTSIEKFQQQRPKDINLNLAIGAQHDFMSIYELVNHSEYSTFDRDIAISAADGIGAEVRELTVEVRTLAEICKKYCDDLIDFIKIDVEGGELEVIKGADWKMFRPTMLVIESAAPCKAVITDWKDPEKNAAWNDWEPLLFDADYVLVYYDGLNRYYLRKEDDHLKNRFYLPITPLQDWFSLHNDPGVIQAKELADSIEKEKIDLSNKLCSQEIENERLSKNLLAMQDEKIELQNEKIELAKSIEHLRQKLVKQKELNNLIKYTLEEERTIKPLFTRIKQLLPFRSSKGIPDDAYEASADNMTAFDAEGTGFSKNGEKSQIDTTVVQNKVHIKRPLPDVEMKWSWKDFNANSEKKIIQVGWSLARMHAIHILPDSDYKKMWIQRPGSNFDSVFKEERVHLKERMIFFDHMDQSVTVVNDLPGQEYEELICANIAFAHYTDASAPDFLLHCIARHTPILINALPEVREYLGDDYPFYYYSYKDAVEKVSHFEQVKQAHDYLRQVAGKMNFSPDVPEEK